MRSQGPQQPLSSIGIANAAIAIADSNGLAKVSMRGVASSLGVEAMSLYHHVKNKEALLDLMVDQAVGAIALPAADLAWQDFLRERCRAAHVVLKQHPWLGALLVSRVNVGPNMLRYVDATIGALVTAGFSYPEADHAWNAVDNHLYGFALQEANFPFEPEAYASAAAAYLPSLRQQNLPHLTRMTELVAERAYDGLHDFDFGLDLIINSLEQRLHSQEH
jgi:AcrR family transcriptional regulator